MDKRPTNKLDDEQAYQVWKKGLTNHLRDIFNVSQLAQQTETGEVRHLSEDNTLENRAQQIERAIKLAAHRETAAVQQTKQPAKEPAKTTGSWNFFSRPKQQKPAEDKNEGLKIGNHRRPK